MTSYQSRARVHTIAASGSFATGLEGALLGVTEYFLRSLVHQTRGQNGNWSTPRTYL